MARGPLERLLKATATGRRPHFPVVSDGNTGWFWLGGTELDSVYNRTRRGAQGGAKVNTQVTWHEHYASLKSVQGYIKTGIADTGSFTYILVCRSLDVLDVIDRRPSFMASRVLGGSGGIGGGMGVAISSAVAPSIVITNRVAIQSSTGTVSVQPTGGLTIPDITEWTALLASYNAATRVPVLKNLGAGVSATASPAAAGSTRVLSAEPVSIGTDPVANAKGTIEATFFATWNRVLTETEEAAQLAEIRTLHADLKGGITL